MTNSFTKAPGWTKDTSMLHAICRLSALAPVVLLLGCQSTTVYWSEIPPGTDREERGPHSLMRWTEGDAEPETIFPTSDNQVKCPKPMGIALDAERNRIFWAEPETSRIMVADLDKREPTQFPAPGAKVDSPGFLAIDVKTDRLFWSAQAIRRPDEPNAPEPKIQYANLSGKDRSIHNFALGIPTPAGIAIDARNRRLFWVALNVRGDHKQFGILQCKSLDEPDCHAPPHSFPEIRQAYFQHSTALTINPKSGTLMWANNGINAIAGAKIEGDRVVWSGCLNEKLKTPANSVTFDDANPPAIYYADRYPPSPRIYRGKSGATDFQPIFNSEAHAADIQVTHDWRLRSKKPSNGQ